VFRILWSNVKEMLLFAFYMHISGVQLEPGSAKSGSVKKRLQRSPRRSTIRIG